METRLEQTILKNLIQSEEFARKCIPFIRSDYFTDPEEKVIFEEVRSYFDKYTKNPTTEALLINLDNNTNLNDSVVKNTKSIVEKIGRDKEETPQDWLVTETESWCVKIVQYTLQ